MAINCNSLQRLGTWKQVDGMFFEGNEEDEPLHTKKTNYFSSPVVARYVRINPEYQVNPPISLRADVLIP
jgi:hypothetical protein